jgi:tellurite resistance protein TehA-like permease
VKNTEIWVFIFILGLLGLNWPIIEIFHTQVVAYLFVIWVLFIALIALAARKYNAELDSREER